MTYSLLVAPVPPSSGSHHTSHLGFIIFGIAAIVIGSLHVGKPDLTWRMSKWQYRNSAALEPSHAGLVAIRLGGLVAVVVGVVFLVLGIA